MEDKSKKKTIVSLVSGIVVILILLIGAAYAYFRVLAINNFGSKNATARAGNLGSVVLSGTNANLSMELSRHDMYQTNSDVTYYAGTNGKTTTPTEVNFGTAIANTGNDSITNDSYATYHCEYQLNVTHSVNDSYCDFTHDLYYVFNSISNSDFCRYYYYDYNTADAANYYDKYKIDKINYYDTYYDSSRDYDFYSSTDKKGYKNASTGQIILTVNGIDYDFFGPWPDTIRGEFDINPNTSHSFSAGLRFVNSSEIDQSYISGASIDINIEVTKFECVPYDNLNEYYWAYEWDRSTITYSTDVSEPEVNYHNLDMVYLAVGDALANDVDDYIEMNTTYINSYKGFDSNKNFKRLDQSSATRTITLRVFPTLSICQNYVDQDGFSNDMNEGYFDFDFDIDNIRCISRTMDTFSKQYFDTSIASDTNNRWEIYYHTGSFTSENICQENLGWGGTCVEDNFSNNYHLVWSYYADETDYTMQACKTRLQNQEYNVNFSGIYSTYRDSCEKISYMPVFTQSSWQYDSLLDCFESLMTDSIEGTCSYDDLLHKWIKYVPYDSYTNNVASYGRYSQSDCQTIVNNIQDYFPSTYTFSCMSYEYRLSNIVNSNVPSFTSESDCNSYISSHYNSGEYGCYMREDDEWFVMPNLDFANHYLSSSRTFDTESDCTAAISNDLGTFLGYSCYYDSNLTKWKYRVAADRFDSALFTSSSACLSSFNQLLNEANIQIPSGWSLQCAQSDAPFSSATYKIVRTYQSDDFYSFNSLASCESSLYYYDMDQAPRCVKYYLQEYKYPYTDTYISQNECEYYMYQVGLGHDYPICKQKYQNGDTIYDTFSNDALPPKVCANIKNGNNDNEVCLPYDAWLSIGSYKTQLEGLGMTCEYKRYTNSRDGNYPSARYYNDSLKILPLDNNRTTFDGRMQYLYCKNDKLYFIITPEKVSASIYQGLNYYDLHPGYLPSQNQQGSQNAIIGDSDDLNVSLLATSTNETASPFYSAEITCTAEIAPIYSFSGSGGPDVSVRGRNENNNENNIIFLKEYSIPKTDNINAVCYYGASVPTVVSGIGRIVAGDNK